MRNVTAASGGGGELSKGAEGKDGRDIRYGDMAGAQSSVWARPTPPGALYGP